MQTEISKTLEQKQVSIFQISTFILVNFLFFIDEGFYDFRWMKSFGNWFVFAIYFLVIFGFQYAVWRFIFAKINMKSNAAIVVILGAIIGLITLFKVFS